MEADVVVVGAGGCGLAAALAARARAMDVIVVEKSERIGGNTVLSTGSVPAAGTRFQAQAGIEDSPESMADDLLRQAGYESDPEMVRRLCRESGALVEWLVDEIGVGLDLVTDYKHVGHSVHRIHAPASREGADLVRDLERAVRERGVEVLTDAPATSLLIREAVVEGVEIELRGRREQVRAGKVVLGSNGFAANAEMVRQHCPDVAEAPYYGAPGNTGEGIVWGSDLGGVLENMGAYQGYAAVCSSNGVLVSWTTIERGGILVDGSGLRFGDETAGYSAFLHDVQTNAGGRAYAIFDHRIVGSVGDTEPRFRGLLEAGVVKAASTLDELVSSYGMPIENLGMTLARYRSAARAGVDEFGRRDFGWAPLEYPMYIVEVVGGLYHTQGGLRINMHAQPLRADGSVIPNLYAGGGAAVGISGATNGKGYSSGNGLLTALGWGRIAGDHAGREMTEERSRG